MRSHEARSTSVPPQLELWGDSQHCLPPCRVGTQVIQCEHLDGRRISTCDDPTRREGGGDVDKDRPLSGDDEPPDPTWANDRRLGPDATTRGGRTFDRHNSVSATGSEDSHLGQLIRKRLAGREVILPEHSGRLAPLLRKTILKPLH